MKEIFNYNGTNITFSTGNGNVMVNLTEVAKAFPEKNLSKIANSKEIKSYVNELSAITKGIATDLLTVENGVGTWAHQKVALRICQKLSTSFAIWVDGKIEEILTTGVATVSNDDEAILHAMQVLQNRVEENRRRVQILEDEKELQQKELKAAAPKVQYFDEVLQSTSTYTMTQVAKELGCRPMHSKRYYTTKALSSNSPGNGCCMPRIRIKAIPSLERIITQRVTELPAQTPSPYGQNRDVILFTN